MSNPSKPPTSATRYRAPVHTEAASPFGGVFRHIFHIFLVMACSVCVSTRAEAAGASKKEAQALLRDGKRLMGQNQLGQACPKLEEAQRLSPSPGTLVQVALCHEKQGLLATAYREFHTVLVDAPSDPTARSHVGSLENKMARVIVKVPDGPASVNVEITLDGVPFPRSVWNEPQPIDPGQHGLIVRGGESPWSKTFTIARGADRQTIEVMLNRPAKAESPTTVASTELKEQKLEDPSSSLNADKPEASDRTAGGAPVGGYVLLGVGAAGLAIGTVYGLRALSLRSDSNNDCKNGCTQAGVDENNRAKSAAWASDVAFGVGVLAAGIGTYLLLSPSKTEPEGEKASASGSLRVAPSFTSTAAGISLRGAW